MPDKEYGGGSYNSGYGTGGSKATSSSSGSSKSSMGFSGGSSFSSNNNSGKNWGGSSNQSGSPRTSNVVSRTPSGNSWSGMATSGNTPGTWRSGGSVGGALSAGLGGAYSNPAMKAPVSFSGQYDYGQYHRFSQSLPGMTAPTKFDNSLYKPNVVNRSGVPMVDFTGNFDSNLNPQGSKVYQAVVDTALRTNQPITFFSGRRASGSMNHDPGYAVDIRLNDPVSGAPVYGVSSPSPAGALRAGLRNPDVLDAPYRAFANDVFDTVYQNPNTYTGVRDGLRWGGDFTQGVPKDWMHFDATAGGGLSPAAREFRQMAAARAAGSTQVASGPLSDPATTSPIRLAMAGMSAPASPATQSSPKPSVSGLNAPYSNIGEKTDLQVASASPSGAMTTAQALPSYYSFTNPTQRPYNVAMSPSVAQVVTDPRVALASNGYPSESIGIKNFYERIPQDSTAVAGIRTPGLPLRADANLGLPPGYAERYLTPPAPVLTSLANPVVPPPEPMGPAVPASSTTSDIPYPVDPNSWGYKFWKGGTYIADALAPGPGMAMRYAEEKLRERWPSMTNEERQAYIDKWNAQNRTQLTGNTSESRGSQPSQNQQPTRVASASSGSTGSSSDPGNASWKQDAITYGFTEDQLKDPEIAAYAKQLWDMGWIPKTATA